MSHSMVNRNIDELIEICNNYNPPVMDIVKENCNTAIDNYKYSLEVLRDRCYYPHNNPDENEVAVVILQRALKGDFPPDSLKVIVADKIREALKILKDLSVTDLLEEKLSSGIAFIERQIQASEQKLADLSKVTIELKSNIVNLFTVKTAYDANIEGTISYLEQKLPEVIGDITTIENY